MPISKPKLPEYYTCNEEAQVSMAVTAVRRFINSGLVLLREQRQIYQNLSFKLKNKSVIEYGCGTGVGSYLISLNANIVATDVSQSNIAFAKELYPNLNFDVWDIKKGAYPARQEVAIAVEVIEHVADIDIALQVLCDSAPEVYFSSPNRNHPLMGKMKPVNQTHVAEYTPDEILEVLDGNNVKILDPFKFTELAPDTSVSPLVYYVSF
tara:strand:- start:1028 stop:1654 length:627 start_codon:yes stop_codon:yes gene_type:complete